MKVWLPYVTGGSGMDLFTRSLADGLKSLGCEVTLTNFPHYLQYAPTAMSRAKAPNEVDVVLVNSWNGFAFRRPGAKLVAVCHLCVHDPALAPFLSAAQAIFYRTLIKYFERRTFSVADAIVVPSVATAMGIQNAFHVEPAVIPNGIDTDFFTPGTTTPDSGGRFRLLFVGNPTKRKGADLLGPLMSRLGSDYVLEYTSGLRDRGVISGPNVLPLGSLDQAAVREAYRRADAFVFPTRLEGLPLTVLEAMACGLPIIGSDRTSMPEVVTDGREGFLRPPEIEPLAAAIEQLRADNETRNKMGRAARERAVREFRTDRMARDYYDFFRDLCGDGHSRRHALAVSPTHRGGLASPAADPATLRGGLGLGASNSQQVLRQDRTMASPMHLFLIRTPFQAYLCRNIIAQEGIIDYDVIYISRNPNNKDEKYFEDMAPRRGVFFKYLGHLGRIAGYTKAVRMLPGWVITTRYTHIYIANFSLWYFRTIIGWQRQATVCTYDEGSTNYIDKAARMIEVASPRDRILSTVLGGRPIEWFAANIWRHYAVNADLPNIVDPAKVVGIQAGNPSGESPDGPPLTISVGQPFLGYLTPEQEGRVLDYMRNAGGLYFLHPMEQEARSGLAAVESDLIIEDFVEHKLQHHRRIDLVGAWSTALMTINLPRVRKIYLDADGAPDKREVMLRVGCEVITFDAPSGG